MGLLTQLAFHFDVYNFGDINTLTSYSSSWFCVPVMSGVMSGVVQFYFAWRIWVLGRSIPLVAVIIFVSFIVLGRILGVIEK